MPVRVPWETQYALSYRTTAIGANDGLTSGLFNNVGNQGIGSYYQSGTPGPLTNGKCGFLLDEKPPFDPGVEVVTTEKTTGLSQPKTGAANAMGIELALTKKAPKLSVGSMGLTPEKLEVLCWSLFQKGASESPGTINSSPYTHTFVPYVLGQADPEMYLDISRSPGDPAVTTAGELMTGCVCTQLGIKGSQGERMILSAEFAGHLLASGYNHTASDFGTEPSADHSFLNFAWTIGGTAASIQSVDITIANNVATAFYGATTPTAYTMGKMSVSGNFELAMSSATVGDYAQITKLTSGADVLFKGISNQSASNYIEIGANIRYTGGSIDPGEVELLLNMPFQGILGGVAYADNAIKVVTKSVNRMLIP